MFGKVETFGVGDAANNFPMLKAVDRPFFYQGKAMRQLEVLCLDENLAANPHAKAIK